MNAPLKRVVVAGADSAAWLAALSLARAFRYRQLEVTLIDAGAPGVPGRWTLPSQRGIHSLLGIGEADFVERTGATFKLASEHVGWQGERSRFLHGHGEIGIALGGVQFYKFLLREALAGRGDAVSSYALAGAAAAAGKFARPMGDAGALTASFTYGFHLDEAAYVAYLRAFAAKVGVASIAGSIAGVERGDDGRLCAVRLADGTTVAGDFFVDCTGRDASLLNALGAGERVDWSAWLPCDRMLAARAPADMNPAPVTRITAANAGWLWRMPLARESVVGYVYSSAFTSEEAARAELGAAEPAAQAASLVAQFSSGRRRSFWEHNCVAVGSAALQLEPLAGAELHAAQLGVSTLIELFPLDQQSGSERVEYNRLMVEHCDALRDFTIAHYVAGAARAGAFWQATCAVAPPERLMRKLNLFRANGRIELLDHETFEEVDWAWLLIGAGCTPDALELSIDLQLERVGAQEVTSLKSHVRDLAVSMPPHIEYVRRMGELAARAKR